MSPYLQAICVIEINLGAEEVVCFEEGLAGYDKARKYFMELVSAKCPYGTGEIIESYADEGFFISSDGNYSVYLTTSKTPEEK